MWKLSSFLNMFLSWKDKRWLWVTHGVSRRSIRHVPEDQVPAGYRLGRDGDDRRVVNAQPCPVLQFKRKSYGRRGV